MLLVSIYHMIQTSESFNPPDNDSLKTPRPSKPEFTTVDAFVLLVAHDDYYISLILHVARVH